VTRLRLPLAYKRELNKGSSERKEFLVRLMGSEKMEIGKPQWRTARPVQAKLTPMLLPKGQILLNPSGLKLCRGKPECYNYYFNKIEKINFFKTSRKMATSHPPRGIGRFKPKGDKLLFYAS
jgi:hypothetical protein